MTNQQFNSPLDQAHVVILNNYIRQHHVLAYKALEQRVGRLTILLSTEMEPDRNWEAEWNELDVRVQKNWMYTSKWKHSSGFEEPNFIHVPVDTSRQLRKIQPDIVFSYELGMRTLLSSWFRFWNRDIPLVMVGNMSEHIERERGILRRMLRTVLRRTVDCCTYNGPSCLRYLKSLGFSDDRLHHVPYCFDLDSAWHGEKTYSADGTVRLLYCGAISSRKGIVELARCLNRYVTSGNETRKIVLTLCGSGPLQDQVEDCITDGLEIVFRGNCDTARLTNEYRDADISVFPTLADEWGLVPIEAMASGIPVLGSRYAQSMEEICRDGENGWMFSPTDEEDMMQAVERALSTGPEQLARMGRVARDSVEHITPERTAESFCSLIEHMLGDKAGIPSNSEGERELADIASDLNGPLPESSAG